jgi:hypothetical protein
MLNPETDAFLHSIASARFLYRGGGVEKVVGCGGGSVRGEEEVRFGGGEGESGGVRTMKMLWVLG